MQNVNHIIYSRQIDNAIPGSLILLAKFKNANAYRREGPVIFWPFSQLQAPKLKPEVLPDTLRELLKNLSRVALPHNARVISASTCLAHGSDYSKKPDSNIHLLVYRRHEYSSVCADGKGCLFFHP